MSNAKLEKKRRQGRARTARCRQVLNAEKETAKLLAEFRTKQLLALLTRALHTEVDAADEAGEDDWFFSAGTGMSRRYCTENENATPDPENVVWRNPRV